MSTLRPALFSLAALSLAAASPPRVTAEPSAPPALVTPVEGELGPRTLQGYRQMALLYQAQGDLGAAVMAARSHLALARVHHGTEAPQTADALALLGELLVDSGDLPEAAVILEKALALGRELHQTRGWTLANRARQVQCLQLLAGVLPKMGRADEVPALRERARAIQGEVDTAFQESLRREIAASRKPLPGYPVVRRGRIRYFLNGVEVGEIHQPLR